MGIFQQFPYSNFHEMNLDEIIKIVKQLADEWVAYQAKWNDLYSDTEKALQDFKDYVYAYFENLDLQVEVGNKIDQMVADGTFGEICRTQLSSVITDWLAANITQPVGVVIDTSLSVAGACADAKATGDAIDNLKTIMGTTRNLWDGSVRDGYIDGGLQQISGNANGRIAYIPCEPNTYYTVSKMAGARFSVATTTGSVALGTAVSGIVQDNTAEHITILTGATAQMLVAWVYLSTADIGITAEEMLASVQIEKGQYYTEYVQHNTAVDSIAREAIVAYLPKSYPFKPLMFNNIGWLFNGSLNYDYNVDSEAGYAFTEFSQIYDSHQNDVFGVTKELIPEAYIPAITSGSMRVSIYADLNVESIECPNILIGVKPTWNPASNSYVHAINRKIHKGWNVLDLQFAADALSASEYSVITFCVKYADINNVNSIIIYKDDVNYNPKMTDLLFWGDSLTAGAGGGGTNFPEVCANELGKSFLNCGVGGEDSNTIAARQGGNSIVIPAGSINGTYPVTAFKDIFDHSIEPLRQGHGEQSGRVLYIDDYRCVLSISQLNATDPNATYTISGYAGSATNIPKLGKFMGSAYTGEVVVILIGQNGSYIGNDNNLACRIAIIDSMIKHLDHNKYVIMGLTSGNDSSHGTQDAELLAKYGNKFFPSREYLSKYGLTIEGISPTPQDTADMAAGAVPTSLFSDAVHLNAYGYDALGKLLANKITSLGYFNDEIS